jgi:hypothetical protein
MWRQPRHGVHSDNAQQTPVTDPKCTQIGHILEFWIMINEELVEAKGTPVSLSWNEEATCGNRRARMQHAVIQALL